MEDRPLKRSTNSASRPRIRTCSDRPAGLNIKGITGSRVDP